MLKTLTTAVAAAATFVASFASASTLLILDLSTTNQLTISSTSNASLATVDAADFIGVLLADFVAPDGSLFVDADSADLNTPFNAPDAFEPFGPTLFQSSGSFGLNLFSFTEDSDLSFFAGEQAFTGTAVYSLAADVYARFLNAATAGAIFAPADTDDDIANAVQIGSYSVITDVNPVPVPAAAALFLTAAGAGGFLKRRKKS